MPVNANAEAGGLTPTIRYYGGDGNQYAPTYGFVSNSASGMFLTGTNNAAVYTGLGFSVNGITRLSLNLYGVIIGTNNAGGAISVQADGKLALASNFSNGSCTMVRAQSVTAMQTADYSFVGVQALRNEGFHITSGNVNVTMAGLTGYSYTNQTAGANATFVNLSGSTTVNLQAGTCWLYPGVSTAASKAFTNVTGAILHFVSITSVYYLIDNITPNAWTFS